MSHDLNEHLVLGPRIRGMASSITTHSGGRLVLGPHIHGKASPIGPRIHGKASPRTMHPGASHTVIPSPTPQYTHTRTHSTCIHIHIHAPAPFSFLLLPFLHSQTERCPELSMVHYFYKISFTNRVILQQESSHPHIACTLCLYCGYIVMI